VVSEDWSSSRLALQLDAHQSILAPVFWPWEKPHLVVVEVQGAPQHVLVSMFSIRSADVGLTGPAMSRPEDHASGAQACFAW